MTLPVLTFQPNWESDIIETWAYRTEVQQAYDGRETRRRLRDLPRRDISMSVFVARAGREWLTRRMALSLGLPMRVPLWMDAIAVSVPAAATSVSASAAGYGFVSGGEALLWESPSAWHVCDDIVVTPSSISWTTPTATGYAGRIMPLVRATVMPDARAEAPSITMETWRLEIAIAPGAPLGRASAPTLPVYHGLPVYARKSGERDRQAGWSRRVERVDFGVGDWREYAAWVAMASGRDFDWTLATRQDIAETLGWLHSQRGKWGSWWWDTWGFDLWATAPIAASDTLIAVSADFPLTLLGATPPEWSRDVTIRTVSGTAYRRRLTAWTATSVTIDAPLGVALALGDIDRISWLWPARYDTDTFELRWRSTTICELSARIRRRLTA